MDPLKPGDPAEIGGHRLIARLGAGGMGVVYLARSAQGSPVALKVIRAEYAADPGFRARFRREAEAATRITGRWTVPATAADAEARAPWLATAFIPAPSLAEAVAGHGPLPPRTVRILGERLAEALAEVHATGLVHRDVKPANVLLAADGPRLIDFGIARTAEATALTAADSVIGSPGYLSPEQAQARAGAIGPPSDVFALGCVLAYAATGRRPFGTGTVAAILFRTVHEEPELDAVPAQLTALVRDCLSKDPAARPTADEVRTRLAGAAATGADWLPPALPRLIAERSARVLDLPVPEPTEADTPAVTPATTPGPATPADLRRRLTRRRLLTLGSAGAGVVAAGGGAAWWAVGRGDGGTGGGGDGALPRFALGLQVDRRSAAGRGIARGVALAIDRHNARTDRPFGLALRTAAGEPDRAGAEARRLVAEEDVVAVIGPTSDPAVRAVAPTYNKAAMPLLLTTPVGGDLDASLMRGLLKLSPDLNSQTSAMIRFLSAVEPVTRTAVVEDRAGGEVSWRLAGSLKEFPPSGGRTTVHQVAADRSDFAAAVRAALAADAQAVVYAGVSPGRAARLARALVEARFKGPRVAPEAVLTGFVAAAGEAADGWTFTTTFVDPARLPRAADFVTAYRERYATDRVDRHAVEAYDAVCCVAAAMTALGADRVERGAIAGLVRSTSYKGLAKTLAISDGSHGLEIANGLFLWRIEKGRETFLGLAEDL
ncbi:bifunctional serine/threonine-protein kinase/ABC transporter substrate-binding protein [Streptomyces sp. NPDC050418]|uniref:bifunctional serine/threonine-protein kinase/ABC transporter substrate-binding protein n=1 Tax=Streptomyces sp. NPDC050418 TaxID=3365612 RepID=UPI0037AEAE4D